MINELSNHSHPYFKVKDVFICNIDKPCWFDVGLRDWCLSRLDGRPDWIKSSPEPAPGGGLRIRCWVSRLLSPLSAHVRPRIPRRGAAADDWRGHPPAAGGASAGGEEGGGAEEEGATRGSPLHAGPGRNPGPPAENLCFFFFRDALHI